jgi:hypothetical protein
VDGSVPSVHADIAVADFLSHHGVKGMKWGVRNDGTTNGDFVLSKSNPLYNISADKPRDENGQIYAAFTKDDVLNYRTSYARQLKILKGASKVFSNSFDLKTDIKVAGEKTQVEAFKKLWESDKDGVAKALAQSQVDISISAAIMNRVLHINRTNAYEKRFMKASEEYMLSKGFKQFQAALAVPGNNFKTPYYSLLAKRGYRALLDINDLKAMDSEKPVLVFKGTDVLRNKKSLELTDDDIRLAMDTWFDKDALDKYDIKKLHAKHAAAEFMKYFSTQGGSMDQATTVDDILAHFGVKGMKWGKRSSAPSSADAEKATAIKVKAKKSKTESLSNAELQAAINRMQLEQNFKRLRVNEKSAATRFISSTLMEIGKREVQATLAKKVAKKVATGGLG